jgi:hypothetical protein
VRVIEFRDKLGEMYVHRLLKLEPELHEILKPLDLSKIGDEFFDVMDTVRVDARGVIRLLFLEAHSSPSRRSTRSIPRATSPRRPCSRSRTSAFTTRSPTSRPPTTDRCVRPVSSAQTGACDLNTGC